MVTARRDPNDPRRWAAYLGTVPVQLGIPTEQDALRAAAEAQEGVEQAILEWRWAKKMARPGVTR